jgi:hypothetical protein
VGKIKNEGPIDVAMITKVDRRGIGPSKGNKGEGEHKRKS